MSVQCYAERTMKVFGEVKKLTFCFYAWLPTSIGNVLYDPEFPPFLDNMDGYQIDITPVPTPAPFRKSS